MTRLARQAEVSKGPKRESRAEMLWDPEGRGGWTETRELGVWYGLDVTEVMFSSGNGTEKARMGALAAAGETVVDLFAGIGYYTLQLLVNAGVGRVIACEWNPNSVRALRRNLERNGVDARRWRCARAITAASRPWGARTASCSASSRTASARGPSPSPRSGTRAGCCTRTPT